MKVSVYLKKSVYAELKPLCDHLDMPIAQMLRMVLEQPFVLTMIRELAKIAEAEKRVGLGK